MVLQVSANLGFLWTDRPLPDRIRAAKAAGFDDVECHFPYEHAAEEIAETLAETNLSMLGINTVLGPEGFFGLAALADHRDAARHAIDQAVGYARSIKARHINVVPGITHGDAGAEAVFRENLKYAADRAGAQGLRIVIEPLNPRSVPGAHLSRVDTAIKTIEAVGAQNVHVMFDMFHAQIVHGDLETLIRSSMAHIGHVQFAAVHDRGEPDTGELNYPYLFQVIEEAGYQGHLGAEYKPRGETVEAGLNWLKAYRAQA